MNNGNLAVVPRSEFPLARYDEMCRAIDAALEVDEVKDIRDRALAFEVYARQARNIDAERRAVAVRLRAERKAGDLLRESEKNKGGAEPGVGRSGGMRSDAPTTLSNLGISKQQSSDWQRLADVPQEQFEEALADPQTKPTTAGIIAAATPPNPEIVPVSDDALWLWGRLRDFERDGLLARNPADVLMTMTPTMLDEVHKLSPQVSAWLKRIGADHV